MPHKTIILCLTLLLLSCAQKPPSWGGNPRYTVRVKILNDDPIATWNFTYFYDWTQKVERYEHQSPEVDQMCQLPITTFKKDGQLCHVTFATDGWSYVSFPARNFCCQCSKSFGAVRYDWLQQGSTYIGTQIINGKNVTHWTKPGNYLNHFYSTVGDELPVRYFQTKNNIPKQWDFDLTTYNTGPIDPAKFKPQCTTPCSGQCSLLSNRQKATIQTQ